MGVHHHKLPIVTDGLVFQVDGANDLCDNVTNVKNIVTPTETGSFVNQASVVNDAYEFDGVDDYINFDASLSDSITTEFTLECWIKLPNAATTAHYISKYPSFSMLGIGGNLQLYITNTFVGGNNSITDDNIWHFCSLSYDSISGDLLATVDDNQQYSNNIVGYVNAPTTDLTIGCRSNISQFFESNISTVKIYNRALTSSEVSQNYEATKHKFE